jgi:hypothetical protein
MENVNAFHFPHNVDVAWTEYVPLTKQERVQYNTFIMTQKHGDPSRVRGKALLNIATGQTSLVEDNAQAEKEVDGGDDSMDDEALEDSEDALGFTGRCLFFGGVCV